LYAKLDEIEALIVALKEEKERLKRRLVLLRKQRQFLDNASRFYFDLWRLKSESSLVILELFPNQRQLLEMMFGRDVITRQLQVIEDELRRLTRENRHLTFKEIEGTTQVLDRVIEVLDNQKQQIIKQKSPTLQRVKHLGRKAIQLCGGIALIGVDLPTLNWPSVIGGTLLILAIPLDNE